MTRYDVLPRAQRRLLPSLGPAGDLGYVLYEGTAIALQLGHRQSIDFDFFSTAPLNEDALLAALPILEGAVALQRAPDTWTLLVQPPGADDPPVKLSFFGGLGFGRVGIPEPASGGEVVLASLLDLFGHKLKVLLQRVEAKDYRDIAELLRSGLPIAAGLGAARALFGPVFPPADALRALTYFEGGNLPSLPAADRMLLVRSAATAGAVIETSIVARVLTSL